MLELRTFHFDLTHEVGTSQFLPGLNVERTSGQLDIPDNLEVEFTGLFGDLPLRVKLIALGDVNYMTNPLTGVWEKVDPKVSPIAFFKPKEGFKLVMSSITEASFMEPSGEIYSISGVMPPSSLAPLMGITKDDGLVDVELEIESDTFLLTRVRISGPVTPLDQPDTVRVVVLSKFDEPATIRAPDLSP